MIYTEEQYQSARRHAKRIESFKAYAIGGAFGILLAVIFFLGI